MREIAIVIVGVNGERDVDLLQVGLTLPELAFLPPLRPPPKNTTESVMSMTMTINNSSSEKAERPVVARLDMTSRRVNPSGKPTRTPVYHEATSRGNPKRGHCLATAATGACD